MNGGAAAEKLLLQTWKVPSADLEQQRNIEDAEKYYASVGGGMLARCAADGGSPSS